MHETSQPVLPSVDAPECTAVSDDVEERLRFAEAQLATIGEIVSGMAHDIGTPLNIISGYAESMIMSVPEGETLKRKQIAVTIEQTHRIARMIRQMLDIVRPSPEHSGRSQTLEQFAADVVQVSSHMLRRRDVRCRFEPGEGGSAVSGDLPRLYQAMFGVLRGAAQLAGARGQLVLRPADGASGAGFVLEATDGAKHVADLSPLADDAARDDVVFARRVLAEHGGGLEMLADDAGAAAPKLVVRIGGVPA
jgi:K+-sensing histidine kinase KdpD